MPFITGFRSMPSCLSNITSPLIRFTFTFCCPCFSRYFVTVSEQLEQVMPSTFQFVFSIWQIYSLTYALHVKTVANISTLLHLSMSNSLREKQFNTRSSQHKY